jgi:hypothetical protein
MAKLTNINPSRKLDLTFTPVPITQVIGAVASPEAKKPIETVIEEANADVQYNDWQVLDQFEEGLRQALIKWIDTTKEGVVVQNPQGTTRKKTINFQFYGTPSHDLINKNEIGKFSLVFQYTKKIINPQAAGTATLTR